MLPERLPLRLDVGFDLIGGEFGDLGDPLCAPADQEVSVAHLDDVDRCVLSQECRFNDGDEPLSGGGDEAAAIEEADRVRQEDQEQGDERKRPDRLEPKSEIQRRPTPCRPRGSVR